MAKHPRKKQKTSKGVKEMQPLGADPLTDDASKDDEERRLESMLFGTKFVPRDNTIPVGAAGTEDMDQLDLGGNVFNNLMDSDLFFVDDGALPGTGLGDDLETNIEDEDEDRPSAFDDDASDSGSESSSSHASSSSSSTPSSPLIKPTPPHPLQKPRNPPAWTDPSDPPSISLSAPRLRKLRDAPSEDTLSGREYEARLRRQYERINPEPAWAVKARKDKAKEKENLDEEGEAGMKELLASTEGILLGKQQRQKTVLPAGTLEIERLRDANLAAQGAGGGEVKVVAFHPSERVPVLCVGSADRRVRLFNIDGHTNPLLQTLHIPSLPLTSQSSASFHPLGASLLLTGPRPFFYTHDLQTGVTTRHARGLWGTTFNTLNDTSSSRKRGRASDRGGGGGGGEGMEVTAFSPRTGSLLAVAGRGGHVHLVDWTSGAGQVVGSLKSGGGGGGARALWWASERELAVLSGDAEVYLWDVGERRCVRRWRDEGGFRGAGRVMSGAGGEGKGWLAVGSNTGFVNVYGKDSFAPEGSGNPKPLKSIANLTTAISSIRFNHDAQVMAVASQEKKDAMRLIHTPSLTSFSNWPTSSTPLGHVTAVDFSARSEYVAIGNTRGRVLLYHLKDYGYGV